MEQTAVFQEKISVSPRDLHGEISSFEDIILKKLKNNLEGQCSKHGFVVPGSLKLLSRSMGIAEKGRGTADFLYFVKAEGKVYNPPDGFRTEGRVVLKNKMGCYVVLEDAIRVMIPRDLHIGNDVFDSLEVGDIIRLEIKKSQFRANAKHILSIGQFLGKAGEAAPAVPAEEKPVEEGEEEEEEDE
jgi:hypothetical protein